jgi:hypothetical protein
MMDQGFTKQSHKKWSPSCSTLISCCCFIIYCLCWQGYNQRACCYHMHPPEDECGTQGFTRHSRTKNTHTPVQLVIVCFLLFGWQGYNQHVHASTRKWWTRDLPSSCTKHSHTAAQLFLVSFIGWLVLIGRN